MSTASTDHTDEGPIDGLVSQLRVIEDQPLDTRAAAFAQLHERLQATLEGGDSTHRHA